MVLRLRSYALLHSLALFVTSGPASGPCTSCTHAVAQHSPAAWCCLCSYLPLLLLPHPSTNPSGCQILLSLSEANAALTALGSARKRLLARRKGMGSGEAGLAEVLRHQEAQVDLQQARREKGVLGWRGPGVAGMCVVRRGGGRPAASVTAEGLQWGLLRAHVVWLLG
jgi:hypothetical protein